jgi:hypothetical protein
MKVVFVGPSLAPMPAPPPKGVEFRPPAVQGDVMRAIADGATAIGLIDGQFEYVAPVWHKELLYALKRGILVFGASSMGALRAAECAMFGMLGVGRIYDDYASGRRVDDADVALMHAPAELGYQPLTVPLVNVDATLATAASAGLLDAYEAGRLSAAAREIHFKQRSWTLIAQAAGMSPVDLRRIVSQCFTDQKRLDALALLAAIDACNGHHGASHLDWHFNPTPLWRKLYDNSVYDNVADR